MIVKRKYDPLAGQWSLPGGAVEAGETLEACVVREMFEETGLQVAVGPAIEVFDRITRDEEGRVQYHYVLVDYLCRVDSGTPAAASDVASLAWFPKHQLEGIHLTEGTLGVIHQAFAL